ncbi:MULTISPECIES: formate-dependent phosphoribosylglycinamide formyltransferase [Bacteroidales]|jgi:phosphoribosylglycinamide formyltransferase 2|uniref:Formate-dependent phosphoribosylglycinamide formyltransferase n=1 Tax=Xylanibacter rodentium TaxID=2736289 RepID=A0ABX2AWT7_9BACT|nr:MULTISPECIES: formate-dependent phosphoribosylglycinamide formyltransferase [Bacteroidales]NPE12628.1 formate-dependent phosphoribosylglycinamide formyltransferase [Prevotella sp. PJ1A]NPE15144.1 formate-dependent phosphoribosylglycinamide formyltransferase [Xylanibacter rodentium]NPE40129.1 formate-dependent phosphoribosylglycinamide formyltransferase [Prevotella sp. PCJ2]
MKRILLLGSGELGKEFVIAAKRAGQYVIACDRYNDAPAMQVADEREVFNMLDGDALEAVVNKHRPDIIVPEIEAIRTERLFDFEKQGVQVVPSARAVNYTMNRRAIRDLASRELGLRTAKYFYAKTYEEFKTAADEIGFPCVVKPLMSSSGHGQSYVHNDGELEKAFRDAMEGSRGDVKEVIIEEFIDFESEFTLLTVTQKNGPTLFCPPIGHVQKGGDYRESWQPYKISDDALKQAQRMADEVTRALTGAGIWGVEFFLTKQGEVIFSELSPRPHDTGMVTLGHTTNLSEFELHFRAVMGLPIAGIHLEHAGASAVVLSPVESDKPLDYNFADALKEDRTRIRVFGKPEAHFGRRMGVTLCYGEPDADIDALRDKAKRLAKTVLGTDPYMDKD